MGSTHLGAHAPRTCPGWTTQLSWTDLHARAIHLHPAADHTGLVIANLVGGLAEAVHVPPVLALLHHAGNHR